MFQHGVMYELIPVEAYQRLKAVRPVEMDYIPRKVEPVELEIVRATQAELTPVLSDLVELHLLIG